MSRNDLTSADGWSVLVAPGMSNSDVSSVVEKTPRPNESLSAMNDSRTSGPLSRSFVSIAVGD